jgi:hypothetical protein
MCHELAGLPQAAMILPFCSRCQARRGVIGLSFLCVSLPLAGGDCMHVASSTDRESHRTSARHHLQVHACEPLCTTPTHAPDATTCLWCCTTPMHARDPSTSLCCCTMHPCSCCLSRFCCSAARDVPMEGTSLDLNHARTRSCIFLSGHSSLSICSVDLSSVNICN